MPSVCGESRFRAEPRRRTTNGSCMVIGMATQKVTITLPVEQLDEIRRLVQTGSARSISGFVQHAVAISLNDAAEWREMLTQGLQETGGPPTAEEQRWVDSILGPAKKPKKRSVA
jgi:Arc/MetJ-type ribon-helix-helix transcriptional regulator